MKKQKAFLVGDLFSLVPGHFHARSELDDGLVPLISCGWENNGVIGHFDIPDENTHERALTVSFNGAPLTTNFHPYKFGAKDDVAVLVPIDPMTDGVLIYVASLLNAKRWRYSYGRKCYREKLRNVNLTLPVDREGRIDSARADGFLAEALAHVRRSAQNSVDALLKPISKNGGR